MIESIKIKLETGKEIELTQEEARLLMAELKTLFSSTEYVPVYPPVSVPFVQTPEWLRPPYKITYGSSADELPNFSRTIC